MHECVIQFSSLTGLGKFTNSMSTRRCCTSQSQVSIYYMRWDGINANSARWRTLQITYVTASNA